METLSIELLLSKKKKFSATVHSWMKRVWLNNSFSPFIPFIMFHSPITKSQMSEL
jgi:hypothetical protein